MPPKQKRKKGDDGGSEEEQKDEVVDAASKKGEESYKAIEKPLVAWYRDPDMGGQLEVLGTPPKGVYVLTDRFQIDTFMIAHNWYPQEKGSHHWRRAQALFDVEEEDNTDEDKIELISVYALETFSEMKLSTKFENVNNLRQSRGPPLYYQQTNEQVEDIQTRWLEEAEELMEDIHHVNNRMHSFSSTMKRRESMAMLRNGGRGKKGKGKK